VYDLALTGVSSSGTVSVSVTKSGYTISGGSNQVTVYYTVLASFRGLSANGSVTQTTTKLTLTFDRDIAGLSAADITLDAGTTGAVKGSLSKTGTGVYDLALTGVSSGGTVSVSVTKSGYAISPGSRQTGVIKATSGTTNISVQTWVDEDGNILVSGNDLTISKTGETRSFTAQVSGAFSGVQWFILNKLIGAAQSITIDAANYNTGNHRLDVMVYKNGVPYSTEIRFTVTN
jgi:hypothetical protein